MNFNVKLTSKTRILISIYVFMIETYVFNRMLVKIQEYKYKNHTILQKLRIKLEAMIKLKHISSTQISKKITKIRF